MANDVTVRASEVSQSTPLWKYPQLGLALDIRINFNARVFGIGKGDPTSVEDEIANSHFTIYG